MHGPDPPYCPSTPRESIPVGMNETQLGHPSLDLTWLPDLSKLLPICRAAPYLIISLRSYWQTGLLLIITSAKIACVEWETDRGGNPTTGRFVGRPLGKQLSNIPPEVLPSLSTHPHLALSTWHCPPLHPRLHLRGTCYRVLQLSCLAR